MIVCRQYKYGSCQVLNVKNKNYKSILSGYIGVACPEMEGVKLCGWYPIKKEQ